MIEDYDHFSNFVNDSAYGRLERKLCVYGGILRTPLGVRPCFALNRRMFTLQIGLECGT